jgi:hypothetical protein
MFLINDWILKRIFVMTYLLRKNMFADDEVTSAWRLLKNMIGTMNIYNDHTLLEQNTLTGQLEKYLYHPKGHF